MYIYSISDSRNNIYIGKTSNIKNRIYTHKSKSKYSNTKLYRWIRNVGWSTLKVTKICECSMEESFNLEIEYIKLYESKGFNLLNEQHNSQYEPALNFNKRIFNKDEIWKDYLNGKGRVEICLSYGISDSMLSKIISENGGINRISKLEPYFKEIQDSIIQGVPIRKLARKYNVCKNSISNINKGITAYDPNLNYPLNKS